MARNWVADTHTHRGPQCHVDSCVQCGKITYPDRMEDILRSSLPGDLYRRLSRPEITTHCYDCLARMVEGLPVREDRTALEEYPIPRPSNDWVEDWLERAKREGRHVRPNPIDVRAAYHAALALPQDDPTRAERVALTHWAYYRYVHNWWTF